MYHLTVMAPPWISHSIPWLAIAEGVLQILPPCGDISVVVMLCKSYFVEVLVGWRGVHRNPECGLGKV